MLAERGSSSHSSLGLLREALVLQTLVDVTARLQGILSSISHGF